MAPTDGYHPGRSHEALADVRATLYLARRMRARAPGTLRRPEKSHRLWSKIGGKYSTENPLIRPGLVFGGGTLKRS